MNYYYIKPNVSDTEYRIQRYLYDLNIPVPKPYEYDHETKTLKMQNVYGLNISDKYGEKPENVPKHVFDEIRKIVKNIYKHNIEYLDITGYNFIEDVDNKIWIIDFGHAKYSHKMSESFMTIFMDGLNEWNEDFQ
jgi:tRNA A-37 threonylcarbamoyl transferase component Bud32